MSVCDTVTKRLHRNCSFNYFKTAQFRLRYDLMFWAFARW